MSTVGYATLQVIPSMQGIGSKLSGALTGPLGQAGTAGGNAAADGVDKTLGGRMRSIATGAAGVFAAAWGAAKIGQFITGSIANASSLGEATSKVGVVFGSASQQVLDFAKNAATGLGQSEAQALAASGTFGNLMRSLGLSESASADMSTSFVTLASDLASFNDTDPTQALDALRAGLTGEAEPLKQFGVNLNAAAIEAEAMRLGVMKAGGDLTDAAKAQAVYSLVMEQTALAQGDFARTSGSLANQQRTLSAVWGDVTAKVGTALLPVLQRMAGFVLDTVMPAVADLAGKFEQNFMPAVEATVAFVRGDLIPAFQETVGWLRDNAGWITVVGSVIGAILLPHLIRLGVQHTITAAKSVAAWVATQVAAVTSSAVSVASTYRMIAAWVAARVAAVASFGQTIAIMALYAGQAIASAARSAAAWVAAQVRTVASLVVTAAGFVAQGAVMVASMAATAASVVAGWVLMGVQAMAAAVRMAAAWLIALGPIGIVIALVAGAVALIIANWETVKTWTINAWNAVSEAVSGAWSSVTGAISSGISTAVTFVSELPGKILGAIGDFGSLLYTKGSDLITGLIDGIASAASFVGGVAKNIVNSIIGFINSNVINGINDLLEFTVAGVTINPPDIPNIPKLAEGGIVPATPGGVLAFIGEGGEDEMVLPRSKARAMFGGADGGDGGRPIHLTVNTRQEIDIPALARQVARELAWGTA